MLWLCLHQTLIQVSRWTSRHLCSRTRPRKFDMQCMSARLYATWSRVRSVWSWSRTLFVAHPTCFYDGSFTWNPVVLIVHFCSLSEFVSFRGNPPPNLQFGVPVFRPSVCWKKGFLWNIYNTSKDLMLKLTDKLADESFCQRLLPNFCLLRKSSKTTFWESPLKSLSNFF